MRAEPTALGGLQVESSQPVVDHRGSFIRCYCRSDMGDFIGAREIVQMNYSRTLLVGAVRGLHFQFPPCAEMKMVRCVRGRVWDVAVDVRQGSRRSCNGMQRN